MTGSQFHWMCWFKAKIKCINNTVSLILICKPANQAVCVKPLGKSALVATLLHKLWWYFFPSLAGELFRTPCLFACECVNPCGFITPFMCTSTSAGNWLSTGRMIYARQEPGYAQTCTQTCQTIKKREQKGRSSVHNSYQTRSCSAHPHMTEQLFPFIAAIWECIREAGWYGLKI